MAHVHMQALARDQLTVLKQCEMIDVEMAEIVRVRIQGA